MSDTSPTRTNKPRTKKRRLRGRLHLPGASRLAGVAVLTGLAGAAAMLLLPVDATVGGDPLLRFRSFDAAPAAAGTVDCGPVLGAAPDTDTKADLYGLASDEACREAADRRMLSAGAAGAVVVLTGLLAFAAVSRAGR
ncbi:MAG: hypothetical protein QOD63_1728 [Actinomycetota bacterium]|nr:hypothetical protein [Actinomycetota bacterium]